MSNDKTYCIYTISCPKSGEVRYVGLTYNFPLRKASHLALSDYTGEWIESLKKEKLIPVFTIIESVTCSKEDALKREQFWIKEYRKKGCSLINRGKKSPKPHYKYLSVTFRTSKKNEWILQELKNLAIKDRRTLNNYIETVFLTHLKTH